MLWIDSNLSCIPKDVAGCGANTCMNPEVAVKCSLIRSAFSIDTPVYPAHALAVS